MSFHSVYRAVYDFAVTDLSAVYFDILKDRLYTTAPRSLERRSAQTAIYRLHLALVRLLAPVLSFTCEEVWRHTTRSGEDAESIHVEYFPRPEDLSGGILPEQRERLRNWNTLMSIREQVLKSLDCAREDKVIGSSLEAAVTLQADPASYPLLNQYQSQLPALFIVSQVALHHSSGSSVAVRVDRARGDKCERCWKYTLDVGSQPEFPTICAACAAVVKETII
jgi:isoleucyl-tRNA synthetase